MQRLSGLSARTLCADARFRRARCSQDCSFNRRAAQLPREAAAARVGPGAEAPGPNITSAASRRLQFGCSLIAATGAPLFAPSRGTGRAAYGGR